MKKVLRLIFVIFSAVLFTLSVFVLFMSKWLLKTWANLTMDELLFHLKANLKGTNPDIIRNCITHYAIPSFAVAALFIAAIVFLRKKKKTQVILSIVGVLASICCIIFAFKQLDRKLMIVDYIEKNSQESTFIEDEYVDPSTVNLVFPETKRNVVYIYLESMEVTYSDESHGGAFEQNVIPELTGLAMNNECFGGNSNKLNGGVAFTGCTYTMGALFAQSSGLPLKTGLSRNDMDTQEEFFPGVVAFGDILKSNGYTNELMIGSRATFGGRQLYFVNHGDYTIFDYDHAVEAGLIPSNYYRWWGYEDEKLFDYARSEMTRLNDEGQPFNLTLLTVDTHFEDGYVCRNCGNTFGDDQYSNVFNCSDSQVSQFVSWIQEQDFYENTTIIICGDHPTMDSDYCENVDEEYSRKVYTCIINPAAEVQNPDNVRQYSTLDMFPTSLAAMGVSIEGDRLGLGTNLFSDEKTLIEKYGYDQVASELGAKSVFLDSLNQISITDTLLDRITTRSDIFVEYTATDDDNCEILVSVDTYTKLTAGALIERLEVEVTYGDTTDGPFTLSGFEADGNIYYNEENIKVPMDTDVTVSFYVVGTDGERYYIKDAVSSSENQIIPEKSTEQTSN